ncbi:MAG: hypothetical protein LBT74_00705 [Acidobacteriota bacterium]|jgi:molybdopterin-guanine dinucleotide biosynthesis protein|nr:hypothetical protein [Acidobacteriota bacterium]
MGVVAVGGHARKVGKTSVAEGLIAALPQCRWTALKVSSHWHPLDGDGRDAPAAGFSIAEEAVRAGGGPAGGDSARFLAAGARRAFWVRVREGCMAAALPQIETLVAQAPFALVEGNEVSELVPADFRILVLNYGVAEFKESARRLVPQADALVAVSPAPSASDATPPPPPPWREFVREAAKAAPLFETADPKAVPAALLDLLRSRLSL